MQPNGPKTYSFALGGWGFLFGLLAFGLLLNYVGLGWVVSALIGLMIFFLSLPILVMLGFRWWLKRTISSDTCPVCSFKSEAIEGSRFNCPSCGEPLYVADGRFLRHTSSDVVEVVDYEVDYVDEGDYV